MSRNRSRRNRQSLKAIVRRTLNLKRILGGRVWYKPPGVPYSALGNWQGDYQSAVEAGIALPPPPNTLDPALYPDWIVGRLVE